MLTFARGRLGRESAFSLRPIDDPVFGSRLVLSGSPRRGWIVLQYRQDTARDPRRPVVRFLRGDGSSLDHIMPGVVLGRGYWLGMLPRDLREIRLALPPGLVLERVGLRSHADLLTRCLIERPLRVMPALYAALRRDERRFRDILRGACAVSPVSRYPAWRARRLRMREGAKASSDLSVRLIVSAGPGDAAGLTWTIEALRAQTHRDWTLVVVHEGDREQTTFADPRVTHQRWDASTPAAALLAEAAALGFLQPGDCLLPDALTLLTDRLAETDSPDIVYGDDEVVHPELRPRLKPDWSPDFALVSGYHEGPCLLARALVERLGPRAAGPPNGSDITLAATVLARRVVHLPRILCLRRRMLVDHAGGRARAIDRQLAEIGSPARAGIVDGVIDLRWPVPQPAPSVSIVIPSRDRLDLIGRVTADVLHRTDYPTLQVVLVDNGSTDPDVLALYETLRTDPRVRIEAYPHPFNFSAMINTGARVADGQILVLLNNDIRVLEPGWLDVLVAQAVRPEVGAVGAKLLYADGRLQHAGVVVGLGGRAGHILRRRPGDTPGHLDRLRVAHEVSAVTAACLAVARDKFEAVGGLDEAAFAVDFNDVDFCLRLAARGWKAMWTPGAVLAHLESVSRGPPVGAARVRFEREAEAFAARWCETIRHDPFYHPGLSLTTFGEDLE